ncbi:MAG: hypothetical protein GXP33_13810 [Spirochaetes bacterium]|nr:hypothetical protein [Spirochaetota bacterium]
MKLKFNLKKFIIDFILIFVVSVAVQYIWNLVFHGQETSASSGFVNFGLAFTSAMTIGIALVLTKPDK